MQQPAAPPRGPSPRAARGRPARASPSATRSRAAPAPRCRRRARAGRRSWAPRRASSSQRSKRSTSSSHEHARLGGLRLAARPGCGPPPAGGRPCRRARCLGSRARAGSMSRGTAMSSSTSGRFTRAGRHERQLLAAHDLVRRAGGAHHDVGLLQLGRQVVEASRPRRRSAAPARARGRSGGWPRTPCARRGRAARVAVSSAFSPAPITSTRRDGQVAEEVGRQLHGHRRHGHVRARHAGLACAPACRRASASRKRRFDTGPVAPSTSASS